LPKQVQISYVHIDRAAAFENFEKFWQIHYAYLFILFLLYGYMHTYQARIQKCIPGGGVGSHPVKRIPPYIFFFISPQLVKQQEMETSFSNSQNPLGGGGSLLPLTFEFHILI
jgi:hypothetical protein